ncbi:protease modulator HflC [Tautonia sociabilis]|uniref:Protein HflC n=1 Tax=Tautonia sociabilis TaxID=2080755 RepID=A0A432MGW6_9BACT|nr:protease modulator HflC [Tautonia sociabilis]RUL86190.1 protease modulator HflC [Tautonia sociabilis]
MTRTAIRSVLVGTALAALLAAFRTLVVVDQAEVAYVTEFGRPVRLIERPGLTFKWPHQSTRRFDKRLQVDSPPPREMLTQDKKNLQVAWSIAWKIADVDTFLASVRTMPDASARLEDLAASVLAAELGGRDLSGLVAVGESSALEALADDARRRIDDQAESEYGVEVVDVQLRRLNYPVEVREAVFEQIRAERRRVAAATRAEGESQARQIRSAADLERSRMLAEAEADAARLIGEGEAAATRIANEAHAADPDFYRFLKTLDAYRAAIDDRTTLVLSADSPFLKLLTEGIPEPPEPPSGPGIAAEAPPAPATAPASDRDEHGATGEGED